MAQLLIKNLDDELIHLLRVRAAQHGNSMEEEHQQILKDALTPQKNEAKIPFLKALLLEMPEISDAELQRHDDYGRKIEMPSDAN